MAARKSHVIGADHRKNIKTSMLLKRLESYAVDANVKPDPVRIRAIEILLRKTVPDLKAIEHTGEVDTNVHVTRIEEVIITPDGS